MAVQTSLQEFFGLVTAEIGRVPREAVVAVIVLAVTMDVWAIALRQIGAVDPVTLLIGVGAILCSLAVGYLASMAMIGGRRSLSGLGAYVGTAALLTTPALCSFALLLWGGSGLLLPALLLALIAPVASQLLCAWPVLQTTTPRFIGPLEAWRRSRGLRWPLLVAGLVLSGMNGVGLDVGLDDPTGAHVAAFLLSVCASVFTAIGMIAISIAAFKRMN